VFFLNNTRDVSPARLIREARGLSQVNVAKVAGLSRSAYQNIETGKTVPRASTMVNIARALAVSVDDLLAPVAMPSQVRFRSRRRMRSRDSILLNTAKWLKDYYDLESIVGERIPWALSTLSEWAGSCPSGRERAIRVAEEARAALGLDVDEPIRDICGLLESAGLKICLQQVMSDDFFGLSIGPTDGGPAVVVNVWDAISVERWIFTAAHELGHLVLHLGSYDLSCIEEDSREETEANVFASRFLMPDEPFRREWNDTRGLSFVERVMKLKRIYRVSYKVVLYRLSEDERYGSDVWRRLYSEYRELYGTGLGGKAEPDGLRAGESLASDPEPLRSREPLNLSEADFVPDRQSRLVRQALERELMTLSRAAEIMRLDIRSMRARASSWVGEP